MSHVWPVILVGLYLCAGSLVFGFAIEFCRRGPWWLTTPWGDRWTRPLETEKTFNIGRALKTSASFGGAMLPVLVLQALVIKGVISNWEMVAALALLILAWVVYRVVRE